MKLIFKKCMWKCDDWTDIFIHVFNFYYSLKNFCFGLKSYITIRCVCVCSVASVVSDFLWHHGPWPSVCGVP